MEVILFRSRTRYETHTQSNRTPDRLVPAMLRMCARPVHLGPQENLAKMAFLDPEAVLEDLVINKFNYNILRKLVSKEDVSLYSHLIAL